MYKDSSQCRHRKVQTHAKSRIARLGRFGKEKFIVYPSF
jgi:hypothetical protein